MSSWPSDHFLIPGETPDPEEVLLAIRVNETKVALKSGFEKYLRVDKDGVVRGIADAVGVMEQWEPVFQVKGNLHARQSSPISLSVYTQVIV